MAERVVVNEQYLQDVADSIRTKLNTEDKYKPSEFSSKIDEMEIAVPVTKGVIINKHDSNGFATDVSIVGLTEIPNCYFKSAGYVYTPGGGWLSKNASVHLPEGLTRINKEGFYNCMGLGSIDLPESLTYIGENAFYYCTRMVLTSLPNSLITISKQAFYHCEKISIKSLPASVTTISTNAFSGCYGITEITINSLNITFGQSAFSGCGNLTKVIIPNVTSVPTLGSNSFTSTPIKDGTGYIYVPDELVESFKVATNWSTYAAQIKPISELEVSE